MSARLLPICLTAGLLAAPALAAPPGPPARLVTATYQVADLVVPVDDSPRTVVLHPSHPCQAAACRRAAPECTATAPEAADPAKPHTTEDRLIKLIMATVAPQSWGPTGGPGQIDYCPQSMALVVQQTPDVQQQVADLLAALRRLQDQEVVLELRFVSVADDVLERVGIDLENGAAPAGGTDAPPQVRFLDDKQVSQFIQTIQADPRTNILQAPKLTTFDGQAVNMDLTDKQYFVTGVGTVESNGQLCFVPNNEPFETGLKLSVHPVISVDRRLVRLDLRAKQTELAGTVPLVPVTSHIESCLPDGTRGTAVPFTQYIQKPQLDTHAVDLALAIPDGGTALITGWRHLAERRSEEAGPPVLSKIPYVNRLFTNVGYRREPEQVLIMVTARVLIAGESEEKVAATPPSAKAEPAPEAAEESEPAAERKPAPSNDRAAQAQEKKLARLMQKYHRACAAGDLERAGRLARMALKVDPACFDR